MGKAADYVAKTEKLLEPIISENSFELVDTEFVKEAGTYYLRAYIDKPGGITIDDCETVSRALSDKLDENDFIDEEYVLEVSSPGLDRPLKKDKDFERHLGSEVEIKLFGKLSECLAGEEQAPAEIAKEKEIGGTLIAYDADTVTVKINETTCMILRNKIALIRLAFDF